MYGIVANECLTHDSRQAGWPERFDFMFEQILWNGFTAAWIRAFRIIPASVDTFEEARGLEITGISVFNSWENIPTDSASLFACIHFRCTRTAVVVICRSGIWSSWIGKWGARMWPSQRNILVKKSPKSTVNWQVKSESDQSGFSILFNLVRRVNLLPAHENVFYSQTKLVITLCRLNLTYMHTLGLS